MINWKYVAKRFARRAFNWRYNFREIGKDNANSIRMLQECRWERDQLRANLEAMDTHDKEVTAKLRAELTAARDALIREGLERDHFKALAKSYEDANARGGLANDQLRARLERAEELLRGCDRLHADSMGLASDVSAFLAPASGPTTEAKMCSRCSSPVDESGIYCAACNADDIEDMDEPAAPEPAPAPTCEFPQHCYREDDGACPAGCGEPGGGDITRCKPAAPASVQVTTGPPGIELASLARVLEQLDELANDRDRHADCLDELVAKNEALDKRVSALWEACRMYGVRGLDGHADKPPQPAPVERNAKDGEHDPCVRCGLGRWRHAPYHRRPVTHPFVERAHAFECDVGGCDANCLCDKCGQLRSAAVHGEGG